MYPKKTLATSQSETNVRSTLNKAQRDQLKKILNEKFTKLYKTASQDQIKEIIDSHIDSSHKIRAQDLQELEQQIKELTETNSKLPRLQNSKDLDTQSVKSGVSKMSGASNFKLGDDKSQYVGHDHKNDDGISLYSQPKNDDILDLNFKDEEEQWAAINKYNAYQYKQELKLNKIKEKELKNKIKSDLDNQINEKHKNQQSNQNLENMYNDVKKQIQTNEEQREQKKQDMLREKMIKNKEMRDQQIQETRLRKKLEEQQEKAFEKYLVDKIKEDLQREEEVNKEKRKIQTLLSKKTLEENEERKRQTLQDQENEKLENIQLMDACIKLLEEQERQRAEEFKAKEEKIQKLMDHSKNTVLKEQDQKEKQLEQKRKKWEELQEKRLQKEDQRNLVKQQQTKIQMRQILEQQMNERKQRELEEKKASDEQADYWKRDLQKFNEHEQFKSEKIKEAYYSHKDILQQQMQDTASKKHKFLSSMNDIESQINKKTLDELKKIKEIAELS